MIRVTFEVGATLIIEWAPVGCTAMKKLRIVILRFDTARQKRESSLNDGRIQNPSNPFGIVPLSRFVPRGFGFVHHSIAILYHEVPNPNLTIRNFFIAVGRSTAHLTAVLMEPAMAAGWIAGGDGDIYGSRDGGDTWIKEVHPLLLRHRFH
jgi:hypothetical protein